MSRLHEFCIESLGRPRILVLKLDSPEDFERGSAALAHLRDSFPNGDITLLSRETNVAAAERLRIADRICAYDPPPVRDPGAIKQQREQLEQFGTFDIAIDLQIDNDTRSLLQFVDATLRCGLGPRQQFPFLDIALGSCHRAWSTAPIDADEIVFDPNTFHSRMPVQTRFFHETDFSVRDTHLIYGPYFRLPVGALRATFAFELSGPRYRSTCSLDLAVEVVCNRPGNAISTRRLKALPNGRLTSVPIEFTNKNPEDRYEFRVFVGGKPRHARLRFFGVLAERLAKRDTATDPFETGHEASDRLSSLVNLVAERAGELAGALRELLRPEPATVRQRHWPLLFYRLLRTVLDPVIEPHITVASVRFTAIVIDRPPMAGGTEETLRSLSQQTRPPHEIIVLGSSEYDSSGLSTQITIDSLAERSVWAAIDLTARRADGTHIIVLEAGSTLHPSALAWFAATIGDSHAPILYSDAETTSKQRDSGAPACLFQPAFDYDLLLQRNYIGAAVCIERGAYLSLGGLADDSEIDPWHDLLLRAVESLGRGAFVHLPLVLLALPGRPEPAPVQARSIRTVQLHLNRLGSRAQAVAHHDALGRSLADAVSVRWPNDSEQRISVIVPTRNSVELIFALVSSLRRRALNWDRVDITVAVNGETSERIRLGFNEVEQQFANVRVRYRPALFNWCAINNEAAANDGTGTILLFLNDDMICLTSGWDGRLVGQLSRREIGVVGARLLYPDGTLQHAGLAIGEDGATAHEGAGDPASDGLYRDRTLLVHGAAIVTGAFLACRRSLFEELGGFDAERYAVTSGDADFCLRIQASGRDVIYDPGQTWIHYESVSRGYDQDDVRKQRRGEAEHALWRSRFTELDLVDLNGNPHLEWGMRPYDAFHCPGRKRIALWLQAQARRSSRWATLGPAAAVVQQTSDSGVKVVAAENGG